MRELLRDRNFRLVALGQALSSFGDHAMFLVFAIWVKELTGSDAAAGLTFLPYAATSIAGPALGVFVDRFPRRRILIATDLSTAVIVLALLRVQGEEELWLLYTVPFLLGLALVVYQAARSGLLVGMLPEERLPDANGFLQAADQAMTLAAPLVGAGLFALLGGASVAVLDAATFLASAACLAAVRAPDIERRRDRTRIWLEIREGLRHIAGTETLRRLTIGTALVTLFVGMSEVAIFALIDRGLHRPPAFLGVIASLQGVGAIVAGLATGVVIRRFGQLRAVALAALVASLALGIFGTGVLPLVLVGGFGFGLAGTLYNTAYVTVMQTRTPLEMQGRVMSAVDAVVTIPYVISFLLGAALVTVLDFRAIYATEALALAGAAWYLWRPASRGIDPPPERSAVTDGPPEESDAEP